jgi:hypothetical protein
MFSELEMGVSESDSGSESTEQVLDTTPETGVDGNVEDTQTTEQSNIPDAPQEMRTVPVDVVESMRREMQEIKAERDRMLALIIEGKQPQRQPEPEADPYAGIDPESFLTAGQMMDYLKKQQEQVNNRAARESQVAREQKLVSHETSFRESNPDYDDTIKALPVNVIQSLYQTYQDPAELVNVAYKMAKALKGEAPSNTSTVKAKVDVENKINKNLNQPKTLSQAKGSSDNDNSLSPQDFYKSRFGR